MFQNLYKKKKKKNLIQNFDLKTIDILQTKGIKSNLFEQIDKKYANHTSALTLSRTSQRVVGRFNLAKAAQPRVLLTPPNFIYRRKI